MFAGREKEHLGELMNIKETFVLPTPCKPDLKAPPNLAASMSHTQQPVATTMTAQAASTASLESPQQEVLRLRGGGNVFADCLA